MVRTLTTGIQDAWDGYFSALYYPVVCLIFLLVVAFNGWYGLKLADDWEQWTIAEWLITYAPGFVRRGLSGEALLFISGVSGWPANQVTLAAFVLLQTIFCVSLAVLLYRKQITFWYFALCLSPGFVLFSFYNSAAVGRKESLIFVAFSLWALFSAGRSRGLGFHLAFGVASALLTLMHEMFFFFTPYFVLLSFLEARREGRRPDWQRSLFVPACSGLALVCILQLSGSLNDPALCDRLIGIGAPAKVCGGILEYHSAPPMEALTAFITGLNAPTLIGLSLAFPIILIPLYLFLTANAAKPMSAGRLTGIEAAVIVLSSPLFVLAVDWGRWISIHVVLLTITCAALLPAKGDGWGIEVADQVVATRVRAGMSAASLLGGFLVLSSMLTWSIHYCCGASVVQAFGPVQAIVSAWEEFAS